MTVQLFLPRKDYMNITINYKGEEIFEIKVKVILLLLLINQRGVCVRVCGYVCGVAVEPLFNDTMSI